MSYRYDRDKKNKNIIYSIGIITLVLFLFTPIYSFIFNSIENIAISSWKSKSDIQARTSNFIQSFAAKGYIISVNEELEREVERLRVDNLRTQYLAEQLEKTITNIDTSTISAFVLDYGSLGLFDNIIIGVGSNDGVEIGDTVIMASSVVIGYISEVYISTSRVMLYSNTTQSINGVLYPHNETFVALGNGGSNFIIEAPREIDVQVGDIFYSQSEPGNIIAVVEYVEFDSRDPFKKVYLSYPINIKQHQIVEIQKNLLQ